MDWGGSTSYQTSFNTGVNTWNARKSGMIRADTASTIQDVTISDYTEENATAAQTSSWGYIRFNTHIMKKLTSSEKKNVCTHELGHALGIGHLSSGDVMYFAVSSVYSLSTNDKNAFTSSWIRIFGIPG
ncbi:MAG: matrixin family metalloprotease [Clostridia bacterium]|nr:matrixin family metalloprotease [Clostridia bacterium]